jgi:hypothetical protein
MMDSLLMILIGVTLAISPWLERRVEIRTRRLTARRLREAITNLEMTYGTSDVVMLNRIDRLLEAEES